MRRVITLLISSLLLSASLHAADSSSMKLLDKPVEVTATFNSGDVGVYFAQISVHNGPIAYLVDTTLRASSRAAAERELAGHVRYRAPYVLVHSSCGGGAAWRCESEHLFKITEKSVVRMGWVIGSAGSVLRNNYIQDVYDKLEQQVDGLAHHAAPMFDIALQDDNDRLVVNSALTWQINQPLWRSNAGLLTAAEPTAQWTDAQWQDYLSALISNAALARYCSRSQELAALLAETEHKLDMPRRRALTDALSRVVPQELPGKWRAR